MIVRKKDTLEKCTLSARKNAPSAGEREKRKSLDFSRLFRVGGRNRTRTCDPIDVNDVLYQLSQQTMFRSEQKI